MSGWTYKHRKMRDRLRKQYLQETQDAEFDERKFEAWLVGEGEIASPQRGW